MTSVKLEISDPSSTGSRQTKWTMTSMSWARMVPDKTSTSTERWAHPSRTLSIGTKYMTAWWDWTKTGSRVRTGWPTKTRVFLRKKNDNSQPARAMRTTGVPTRIQRGSQTSLPSTKSTTRIRLTKVVTLVPRLDIWAMISRYLIWQQLSPNTRWSQGKWYRNLKVQTTHNSRPYFNSSPRSNLTRWPQCNLRRAR